jgi:AAA+ ATPase superfamily predicted ATPase
MSQGLFQPIYPNPYIVGNPIRSREMFFGRLDEFHFIARALDDGRKAALIVLFGERRSGKSSILYQIQNGQLGEAFLPIFVDMQIMAGIANEAEFFSRLITDTGKALGKEGPEMTSNILRPDDSNPAEGFRQFLWALKEHFPGRAPLLLIDEYEILENKISEGCLSRNVLTFFGGLLESERVSFVFTGSKRLESHNAELWGSELLQKATSRKISFLTRDDTTRLVTQPLENKVTFAPEVLEQIYALTAGQPFYTQLICQNLVYHLNEVKKYFVESKDLETVVDGILDNPPPQLIFNWGEHSAEHKLTLALLAEFSQKPGRYLSTTSIRHRIKQSKLDIVLDDAKLKTWLTDLCKDEYLLQQDYRFCFRLDLFRRWIRHDHNIWQVKKEIGQEELDRICERERIKKEQKKKIIIVLERVALALAVMGVVYLGYNYIFSTHRKVKIKTNGGPFIVKVDGDSVGTTIAEDDSTFLILNKLRKEQSYNFEAILLASKESLIRTVEIIEDNQEIPFAFQEFPVTIISDAALINGKLGGLTFSSEGQPESWRYQLKAAAGKYPLTIRDLRNNSTRIDTTLTVPLQKNTVYIDFPSLVVITLKANLPFECRYSWSDQQDLEGGSISLQSAESTSVSKRGSAKGTYQFTFINNKTGEEKPLLQQRITTDTTIAVEFNPNYRKLDKPDFKKPIKEEKKVLKHLLVIISEPPGAQIVLNNVLSGMTNNAVELTEGEYEIKLNKAGYDPIKKEISLIKPDTVKIKLAVQLGYLKVTVMDEQKNKPTGVSVFGKKEDSENEVLWDDARRLERYIKQLPVGHYKIRAESDEYFGESKAIISKNDTTRIIINLFKK